MLPNKSRLLTSRAYEKPVSPLGNLLRPNAPPGLEGGGGDGHALQQRCHRQHPAPTAGAGSEHFGQLWWWGGSQALGTTADFTVTINDATLTLTYNAIAVEVPSFTTSNTVLFTTGLGQTTSVTTNITYNAFSILYAATEALALTATTGRNFPIALPTLQAFGAVALSGQYSVVGPTQTATGNFSTASFAAAGAPGRFRWATFNSLGYPNSSQLTNPNASTIGLRNRWNLTGSIFDVTVDGAQVTANVGTLVINPGGFGNVPLAVPEPASTALLGFGALLLSRRRREPLGFA